MGEITVGSIIANAFSRGLQNLFPLILNFIFWILTIWIPYLNVGTTIGIMTMAIKLSKGESISIGEIFNPMYRKRMGEVFLTLSFVGSGIMFGTVFLLIPGIVIGISWSLAILLVVDKEMNPIEAINESNKATYGKKWKLFWSSLLIGLILMVILGAVSWLLSTILTPIGIAGYVILGILEIVLLSFSCSVGIGAQSFIYEKLAK